MSLQFASPADYDKLKMSEEPYSFVLELPEETMFAAFKTRKVADIINKTYFTYNKPSKVFEIKLELPSLIIPKGTRVHRADHAGAQIPSADMPAFFGNIESIGIYSRDNPNAFSHYTFSKDCDLMILDFSSLQKLLQFYMFNDENTQVLLAYFNQVEGYVNPVGFMRENLEAYLKSNKKYPAKYLNRRMAEIICSLDIPGWIVEPYNPKKKKGLIQLHPRLKEKMPYAPEFMLCNWSEYLVPDSVTTSENHSVTTSENHSVTTSENHSVNGSSRMNEVDGGQRRRITRRRKTNKKKRQQ